MGTQERLQQLETIERDIGSALASAGQAFNELSREKTSQKQVDTHSNHFLKTLEAVESGLAKHISYLTQVSTSQPHEGSSYAAQKDLQMALHRLEHVRSRLTELERLRAEHTRPPTMGQAGPGMGQSGPGIGQHNMGQSGPGMGQPGPGMGQTVHGMGQSGPGIGQPNMGQTGPGMGQPSMGQSGLGMGQSGVSMGQPMPGMSQSGPTMGQSGPIMGQPGMGQSGPGMGQHGSGMGLSGLGMMSPVGSRMGPGLAQGGSQGMGISGQSMGPGGPPMGPGGPSMGAMGRGGLHGFQSGMSTPHRQHSLDAGGDAKLMAAIQRSHSQQE